MKDDEWNQETFAKSSINYSMKIFITLQCNNMPCSYEYILDSNKPVLIIFTCISFLTTHLREMTIHIVASNRHPMTTMFSNPRVCP